MAAVSSCPSSPSKNMQAVEEDRQARKEQRKQDKALKREKKGIPHPADTAAKEEDEGDDSMDQVSTHTGSDVDDQVNDSIEDLGDANVWSIEESMQDCKVAIIGNVDSGKSTLVGVLTKGVLDDGRGKARSKVFNFSHEQANGRTSSVAQEIMGFKEGGEQVLLDRPDAQSAASRNVAWQQIVSQSQKLITFIDLCGHEKYLKTTIYGLVGLCPDHAMIVVNANAGFQRMSREHLGIALALNIPITIVVTKIDITPQNVYDDNMAMLNKMLKSKAVNKQPIVIKSENEMRLAIDGKKEEICPIFCISSVTGEGLDFLKEYVRQMRSRLQESGLFKPPSAPVEYHLDSVYNVTGVGIVVSGLMRAGRVRPNQQLMLGPDKTGQFKPVLVKTIHYKRVQTEVVECGQAACFAVRSMVKKDQLKKSTFRKGMVLVDPVLNPVATWVFKAEVVILHHATTIRLGYQAMVHCGIIRQAATVKKMSSELLRTGDKAVITFKFAYQGEYLLPGTTLLFREGRTKGLGRIIECCAESELDDLEPDNSKKN